MVLAGWLEEYLEKRHKQRLAENRAAARAAGRAEANAAWRAWYGRMREAQAKGESFDELNPYEKALFSDLISLLNHFNRKERFFLVGQALGNREFSLDARFRKELGDEIGVEIPGNAFVAMDYHLDWIAASLWAYRNPKRVGEAVCNSDEVATGTQQDVDLLIAFEQEDCYCLVLVEAKGYDSWSNSQMNQKSKRLEGIFGRDGTTHPNVKPYLCLTSPRKPERLETSGWPTWMKRTGDDPYLWLKLNLEYPRLHVMRCDSEGVSNKDGRHFVISRS